MEHPLELYSSTHTYCWSGYSQPIYSVYIDCLHFPFNPNFTVSTPLKMPGLIRSPRSSPEIIVLQHDDATDFLAAAYPTLRRREKSSNIILAHALKQITTEAALTGCQFTTETDMQPFSISTPHHSDAFWVTVWSSSSPSSPPILDLVLSCGSWILGDYPIFLWTPHQEYSLQHPWLLPRMSNLASYLLASVHPERVFSVFGMTPLVKAFARIWTDYTSIPTAPDPFYAAYFTFCTPDSWKESEHEMASGHRLRRATIHDLGSVAQLCKEFAADSIYYPLTIERATIEAQELISKRQVWVYDAMGDVAAICAATRSSLYVSAITKVYTTPKWRRQGFAEHLVRYVTRQLFESGKQSVVLYVGHDNNAQSVYDRVGFVGLCGKPRPSGVEDLLELGFVGTNMGHW